MLRHQLAVAEREQPRAHLRLTWPDRAWLALLAGTMPTERLLAMGLPTDPRRTRPARHRHAPSTVWQILKNAGIDPAPGRDCPGWAEFLRSQEQKIPGAGFLHADLLNGTKVYVLAVIEVRHPPCPDSRRHRAHPVQSWVVQQARNLLMDLEDEGTRAKVRAA